jgi:sterol desaturase/sphingolipid hydroxylase (fatty acid hydroxylase superfamily)
MATSIVLFSSVAVFVLALLDLLLSEKQKKRLNDSFTASWDYLDRAKASSFRKINETRGNSADVSFVVFCCLAVSWIVFLCVSIGAAIAYGADGIIVLAALMVYFFASFLLFILLHWIILFLTLAFMAIIATVELVVRRVAEHQKGPIIAASSLIAACMAVWKAFGG